MELVIDTPNMFTTTIGGTEKPAHLRNRSNFVYLQVTHYRSPAARIAEPSADHDPVVRFFSWSGWAVFLSGLLGLAVGRIPAFGAGLLIIGGVVLALAVHIDKTELERS